MMKMSTNGRDFLVMDSGQGMLKVYNHKNSTQYIISLEVRECSCGYWQMSSIPYVYIVASLGIIFCFNYCSFILFLCCDLVFIMWPCWQLSHIYIITLCLCVLVSIIWFRVFTIFPNSSISLCLLVYMKGQSLTQVATPE